MRNWELLQTFEDVARLLNEQLNSVPILYGSLGLAQLLQEHVEPGDIDILIEESIFRSLSSDLESLLATIGFSLVDASENEFLREQHRLGVAGDGDLWDFARVRASKLRIVGEECKYRILTLEEYKRVYEASAVDGYRKEVRAKDDQHKLDLISQGLRITCS